MKILYHHRTLGDGAEGIHIAEMVNAFRSCGHQVRIVGADVGDFVHTYRKVKNLLKLKEIARGPLFDLLELGYNIYGFMQLWTAINSFKPHFIYDRYITYNYSSVFVAKRMKIPIFVEFNSPLALERSNEPDEHIYFAGVAHNIERLVCKEASCVVAVSSPLKKYITSLGTPKAKIMILPNGVDPAKFYPKLKSITLMNSLDISNEHFVIGFTGILRPWHGLDMLLRAFKNVNNVFPNTVLLIVGDGPIRETLENAASQLGIANQIRITGRVSHREVAEYLSLFDVAVSPKTTFYASPMKIVEYMAQGIAVVAPATDNICDLIDDGRSGLLFDPGSAEALSKALCKLITHEGMRERLGRAGHNEVHARLNWVSNAKRVIEAYEYLGSKYQNRQSVETNHTR